MKIYIFYLHLQAMQDTYGASFHPMCLIQWGYMPLYCTQLSQRFLTYHTWFLRTNIIK